MNSAIWYPVGVLVYEVAVWYSLKAAWLSKNVQSAVHWWYRDRG